MRHDRLLSALAAWQLPVEGTEPLTGGLNSTTWLVRAPGGVRYVAKLADTADAAAFAGGLRVAARAGRRGLAGGAPVALPDGRLAAELPEGVLALLEYVPGTVPDAGSPHDLRRLGAVLGRAHRLLADAVDDLPERLRWPWPWASARLREVPMPPHVRRAAAQVLDEAREATPLLRLGVVHGDPRLDGFRLSGGSSALDGLVGWDAVLHAPLLYDVACVAVLTRDTPRALRHVLDGYRTVDPAIVRDLDHLDLFVRLRWAVTAIHVAGRIARGALRGVSGSPEDNEAGLARAYAGMRG
ncbi:phosphotransferase enzyme family protein [Nonomuraea terrae]|nr:phosphotransferase [Nonomuraea terrae]